MHCRRYFCISRRKHEKNESLGRQLGEWPPINAYDAVIIGLKKKQIDAVQVVACRRVLA